MSCQSYAYVPAVLPCKPSEEEAKGSPLNPPCHVMASQPCAPVGKVFAAPCPERVFSVPVTAVISSSRLGKISGSLSKWIGLLQLRQPHLYNGLKQFSFWRKDQRPRLSKALHKSPPDASWRSKDPLASPHVGPLGQYTPRFRDLFKDSVCSNQCSSWRGITGGALWSLQALQAPPREWF